MLERMWEGYDVTMQSDGNCLAAIAYMLGIALQELTPAEIDETGLRYPVPISAMCHKPLAARIA